MFIRIQFCSDLQTEEHGDNKTVCNGWGEMAVSIYGEAFRWKIKAKEWIKGLNLLNAELEIGM